MAIVFDKPIPAYVNGRRMHACHMASDIGGVVGQSELLVFGKQIGLKPQWLQNCDTPEEHFDLMGRKIEAARVAGAHEVSRKTMIEIIRSKRNG